MKHKNFLKKLTAGILGFVMTLGVGAAGYVASASEAKAAESAGVHTLTITRNSFSTAGGYAWYDWTQTTNGSTSISGKAELYTTEKNSMQFNKGKGNKVSAIFNTTALPGKITKIEAQTASGSNRKWNAYVSSTAYSASGSTLTSGNNATKINSSAVTIATSLTTIGTSSLGYSYFCIQLNESNASFISQFVITYNVEQQVVHTVSSITGSDSLYKGQKDRYSTSCNQSDTITWSLVNVSPSGCAEIDSSGYVTAKAAGSATVKATCAGGGSATKSITINNNNLVLSDKPIIGESGGTSQLSPKFDNWTPSTTPTYSYSSDNTSIATVSTSGLITFGSTTGTTKVHCTTTVNTVNFSGEVSVTTTTSDPTAQLSKDKSTPYYTGDTYTVTAAFSNIQQADTIIRMIHNGVNTDKTNVSSVTGTFSEAGDYDFVVLNKNDGNKQISETLTISVTASSITDIEIYNADTGEEVTELNFTLPTDASKTVELAARVTGVGHYSSTVTWSSSAPTKVSVGSSSGVVQPLGKVTGAIITATAADGKTDTVTVDVSKIGETITFDASKDLGSTSSGQTPDSVSKEGITIAGDSCILGNGTEYRLYKNNNIVISSTVGNIVKIVFTCKSSDPARGFNSSDSTNPGLTIDETANTATWSGNSSSVTLIPYGAQVRATLVSVQLEASPDITGITLTGNKKTAYATNEKFDATNIGVSIAYEEGNPKTDSYASSASKFAFYKSNSFVDANKLTPGTTSVNGLSKIYVVYDGKTDFAMSYDVTVTSHTITVNSAGNATSVLAKSTLQMSATHDAGGLGDDAITWSVKANDGTSSTTAASINVSSGLLTGGTVTSATTVTVIATCKYGGSGSKKITINPHTITLTGESQAVINRSYSFSVAHDGTDTVSYKVVKPDNTELNPAITTNSFTPTSLGTYKITASCSCCLSSDELQVTVGYAAVSSVVAKYNDAVTDAVSCLTNVTISNFSAVVYDDQGESNTVSQEIVWSIDYTDERTTLTSSEVTFVPSTHSFSSTAAGTAVLLATAEDTNISAAIVITVDAVSASITYEGNPLEVWYGESAKILTAVGQGFTSPRYSWDVAWEGEGEAPVEVTGSPTSKYGTLIYNGVTPVGGITVKVTISEADDSSIVAEASVNVVVKSSGVDLIKIKQNGADVSKETIELWDNGQTASFSYDISSHGIVSDTAVWSASDGYADVLSYSVNDGVITVTTNDKISANKTVRLTATNTSTYGDPSVVSEYVDVLVKKSTVSVTLPEEMPSIYNGQSATTAVTVGSTGNVPAAQNTVTFSKSSDNASGVNDKVTLTQNGLSCTIAVAADYPISTSSTFKVTVTSDYDNSSQDITVTVLQSKVEGFDILDSDNKSISSKTVYASATDKNEVQLKATMSLSGSATGNVTWSFSDGDSPAIKLDKYSSTNGELITVTTNPNYDFGGNNSHTVKLTATSDYDSSKTDTIDIVVKREYVNELTWNNGASVDNFAGTSIGASSWTFDAKYNSSKEEKALTIGNDSSHVHVYAVDDASEVTEEPTDLTPISSSATLSAELNGKQLVAFYKGYKCASTYELTSTGLLHEVWETKQVVDSGTKTTGDIGSKVKTDKAAIFTEDGTKTVGDLDLTLSTTGNSVFFGYDSTDTNKGQQIGSGNYPASTVSLSTSVSGTITQVVIETSGAKSIDASLSVSVGETYFKCNNETSISITNTKTSYTFTGSGTGTISINWSNSSSKAIYFSKVDVTYNNSHQETNQIANTNLAAQKAVIKYAEWFNQYGSESDWSTVSSKYSEYVTGALTGDALNCAKGMFKNAVHTGSDLDVLQECVEAYDQIMYKNPAYANFMERTIAATFVVTIDLDDGSDPTTQKVTAGSKYTLPEAPQGGDFSHWDVNGDSKLPGIEITITENVTIKAVYNETLSVSTDLAFQFTGLTMKKGQIKFSVDFTKADKAKEYGFLVTTNLSNDPTSLSAEDVYGKTVSGYSKVVGKTTAGVASSNLQLEMKVVFYYIDENNQIHFSEVVVTSFEDLAREYDSKTITDQYARACFEYYVSTLDEKAE